MPDIEERLRTALHTLADEVPPAADPRAGLDRRIDARRRRARRVPAIAAAATAAAAIVAIVVVAPDTRHSDVPAGSAARQDGERLADLGTVVRGEETLHALGYLRGARFCTTVVAGGDRTTRPTCEPVPTWPNGQTHTLVQSREVLNGDAADDTGMLANRLVFLTDPRVATLSVRRGDGTAVRVTAVDRNEHAAAFLADFAGPPDGFGYTARDGAGSVLEEAIS